MFLRTHETDPVAPCGYFDIQFRPNVFFPFFYNVFMTTTRAPLYQYNCCISNICSNQTTQLYCIFDLSLQSVSKPFARVPLVTAKEYTWFGLGVNRTLPRPRIRHTETVGRRFVNDNEDLAQK